jgi:hypothetical protein
MHQFSILPTAVNDLKRKLIQTLLFLFAVVIMVFVVIPWVASGEVTAVDSGTMLTVLIVLPAILGFTYFNGLKRQKAMLASYKLTITDDTISREMINVPALVIQKKDVREIIKRADGSITIIADSKLNAIGISLHIERKEELEGILNSIKPMTVKTTAVWYQTYSLAIAMVLVTLMFSSFYLENKFLSSAAGAVFVGVMAYSFIVIHKSKNVDTRTKRLSYFMLIPLFSVIGSLITKWMS